MSDVLNFYRQNEIPYGVFSNFSAHPFHLDGHTWPTSEHYFQACKFPKDGPDYLAVKNAPTPNIAARIGRDRKRPLRADWESVKDDVMRRALAAKFQAHPELAKLLVGTGSRHIVEKTTYDYYWGSGTRGTGRNMLGILLMELRDTLS